MHEIKEKTAIFSPTGLVSSLSVSSPNGWLAEKNKTVSKVYKRTTRYNILDMPKKNIFCFDDSNAYGEYFSLDLNLWEELNYTIDDHKRINVSRQHAGKEIRLF
uniref:hypothetical protein n=1 Tax=Clostridium sp. TaxID=1506 RepID=UPI0035A1C482